MNSKWLLTSVALIAALNSYSQSTLRGLVLGEGGAPLAGATVLAGDASGVGGVTGADGRFTLEDVALGSQRLRITYIGYAGLDTTILVEHAREYVFRLRPSAELITGIEVEALRAGERSPYARTTVTRERIERNNTGLDLPYVLEQEPSVVSTSDGGTGIGYTYMRIRGTDATRTNITVNGVPFNDPESQGAFLVNLPDIITSTEDIEIQRGVGSSTNGPAAFGASVNLRTTSVKREPFASLDVNGGSYNTQRYSVSAGTGKRIN